MNGNTRSGVMKHGVWWMAWLTLGSQLPSAGGHAQSQVLTQPTVEQVARLTQMEGAFEYDDASQGEVIAAIGSATSQLGTPQRLQLTSLLQEVLRPARRIEIARVMDTTGATEVLWLEERTRVQTPLTGEAWTVRETSLAAPGETRSGANLGMPEAQMVDGGLRVSQQLQDARGQTALLQVVEGMGLRQERRCVLDVDRQGLTLHVRVTGEGLAAPLEVELHYVRD